MSSMQSWWRNVGESESSDSESSEDDDEFALITTSRPVNLVTGALLEENSDEDTDNELVNDNQDVVDYDAVLRQMRLEPREDVERARRIIADPSSQRGGVLRTINPVDLSNVNRFQIENSWRQFSETFNFHGTVYQIKPTVIDDAQDIVANVRIFLQQVYDYMNRTFNPSDQISCYCSASGFDETKGGGVSLPFMRLDQFRPSMLVQQIEAVVQSNEDVAIDDGSFTLEIFRVVLPGAGGRINRAKFMGVLQGLDGVLEYTKALVPIPSSFHPMCIPAALWGAQKLALENVREVRRLFKPERRVKAQLRRALNEAFLSMSELERRGFIDLADLKKLAKTSSFRQHPIVIWSREHCFSIVAKYNVDGYMPPLHLLLKDESIFIVRHLKSLLGKRSGFFCIECETFSGSKFNHVCTLAYCRKCKTVCDNPNAIVSNPRQCDDCKRWFNSDICFKNHKKKHASPMYPKKKVCLSVRQCEICERDVACKQGIPTGKNAYNNNAHVCFKVHCSNCGGDFDPGTHRCHIRKLDLSHPKTLDKFRKLQSKRFFYDIETEKKTFETGAVQFQPICVVLMSEDEDEEPNIFYGEDCMKQFIKFVHVGPDSLEASGIRIDLFAHNGGKFDSFLAVRAFLENRVDMPDILFRGNKILKMKVKRVSWFDSLTYLKCSLRQVPKLCGLSLDLRKGFFPHNWNTAEHRDYDGPLPPKESFGLKFHKADEIQEFEEWYDAEKSRLEEEGLTYNLKDEMIAYCMDDVRVLRAGFLKFDKNVHELTGFRCGQGNCTMAGLANLHLLTTIPDKKIGQVPTRGYAHADIQSRLGLIYMHYLDRFVYNGELQHAKKNDGEARLTMVGKEMKRDGFHAVSNTIEEFAGCMWHGCLKCFTPSTVNPVNGRSLLTCREEFQSRNDKLRHAGYTVKVTWECDFKERMKTDEEFAERVRALEDDFSFLRQPFNLRDALFGGRTEAFKLFEQADPEKGESIKYMDVTSLYPSRMAKCEYPWGHPKVLTDVPVNEVRRYKGLIHLKILPTRDDHIPFLPCHIKTPSGFTKLVYTNCYACARDANFEFDSCQHTEDQRAIVGVYTSHELTPAFEAGYKPLKVYEVWHYHNWSTETYKPYVKSWLKVKQEASGYPSWADTDAKKELYIANYKEHEGIDLDPDKIEKNPVLRSIGKFFLNSLWGFLGRRLDNKQKKLVNRPDTFFKLMCDSTQEEKEAHWLTDDCLLFSSKPVKEWVRADRKGSLVHAIYTTAHARTLLTSALVKLGERALYCDTDSIIYKKTRSKKQRGDLKTGDYLGDWADEEPEGTIVKFVAGGAKNYGYVVHKPDGSEKTKFKVRGITLNDASNKVVNFDTLCDLVLECKLNDLEEKWGDCDENGIPVREVEVPTFNFKRIVGGSNPFTIQPEETVKTYKLVFDKRVFDPDTFLSYPFGHVVE